MSYQHIFAEKTVSGKSLSIGYISLCILTSIYLSKVLIDIATQGVKPVHESMSAKSFRYIVNFE